MDGPYPGRPADHVLIIVGRNELDAPENVSNSHAASAYPSIAVNDLGVVHLTWMEGKGDDFEIYYSQLKAKEWSPPRNVSNLKGISQRPQVAIDAAGKVHVVWYDNTGGFFELFHCWRDGATWSKPTNTKLVDWYITHNPGYGMAAGLAADLNGHLHLVWVDIYEHTQDLFHSRWNGESWSKPGIISRNPVRPRELHADADASGNVHLTWEDNGEVWYCHSDGSVWSDPFALSDGVQRSGSPALCLAQNGDVHLAWSGSLFGKVHLSTVDSTVRIGLTQQSSRKCKGDQTVSRSHFSTPKHFMLPGWMIRRATSTFSTNRGCQATLLQRHAWIPSTPKTSTIEV